MNAHGVSHGSRSAPFTISTTVETMLATERFLASQRRQHAGHLTSVTLLLP